jgi:hypothetical protein
MPSQLSQYLTQIDGIHQSSGYKFSLDKIRYGSIAFMCKIVVFAAITIDFFFTTKGGGSAYCIKGRGHSCRVKNATHQERKNKQARSQLYRNSTGSLSFWPN